MFKLTINRVVNSATIVDWDTLMWEDWNEVENRRRNIYRILLFIVFVVVVVRYWGFTNLLRNLWSDVGSESSLTLKYLWPCNISWWVSSDSVLRPSKMKISDSVNLEQLVFAYFCLNFVKTNLYWCWFAPQSLIIRILFETPILRVGIVCGKTLGNLNRTRSFLHLPKIACEGR